MIVKVQGTADVTVRPEGNQDADKLAQEKLEKQLSPLGRVDCTGMFDYHQPDGTVIEYEVYEETLDETTYSFYLEAGTHYVITAEVDNTEPVAAEDVMRLRVNEFARLNNLKLESVYPIAFPRGE